MYLNGSCQLFVTLPFTYTLERNKNSTLILLEQLPPNDLAPCCSNISWLINKINSSQKASANVTNPSFLIIDDNNFLVTLSYQGPLVQLNRSTLDIINSTMIASSPTSLSYSNGFYYILFSNNTWSSPPLPLLNTTPTGDQEIFQTTVDSCGRLWLAITNFGIRIFDPWSRFLLYEWLVTPGINGFLLLDNYELFIADYSPNEILHFNPNIEQCTS